MPNPNTRSFTRRAWRAGAATAALAAQPGPGALRLPKKVRVGLLGLDGHVSEIVGQLPRLPDVEVAAIADPDTDRVGRLARNPRLASARQYRDYKEMLAREELDLVAVNNNNGERAAGILACAERKLHVIAEKPLAIERKDLERVKQAVARSGIGLSMLLPMRFASTYRALKRVVDSGEIGEVAQIAAQKSYKLGDRPEWMRRRETYGGSIPWVGIHMVDLMRWASGREFTEVVTFQSRIGFPEIRDMENTTGTLFRLDNGGVGTLRLDYLRPSTADTHGDDRLRIAGTRGVVELQSSTGLLVMSESRKPLTIEDLPPRGSVFLDFLDSVYNGAPTALPLADIYRVTHLVLAARESAERGTIRRL